MVDEVVNNRQNWNMIDDIVILSSIVFPYFQENNRKEEKEELNDKVQKWLMTRVSRPMGHKGRKTLKKVNKAITNTIGMR